MSKSAKHRFCPAVQREISSAECGENRISHYACPAECPFNPFAPTNYSMTLALDDSLNAKMAQYFFESSADRARVEHQARVLHRHPSPHALHAWITWRQYFARDAGGRTMAERWEQSGFAGLKNDERILIKGRMSTQVTLIEVWRVLDDEQVEVVDLLEGAPRPFVIRDRSFAKTAVRFTILLAWCHPVPHYWRLMGTAIPIPEIPEMDPLEIIREIVRHMGGPLDETELRVWLAEHFERANEALTAVALARRDQMFASLDAKFGRIVYELRRPLSECRALLDRQPDVDIDKLAERQEDEGFSEARVWFESDQPRDSSNYGKTVLGRVLIGQSYWRLEAIGGTRTTLFRKLFEAHMGNTVRFSGERIDDHTASLKKKESDYDRSLVPPRLLENPRQIIMTSTRVPLPVYQSHEDAHAGVLQREHRRFLDSPIPALTGKTPREAARDPQMRPKLVLLMKAHVRTLDLRNLEKGRQDDINWLLRELELTELLFDPPPLRPPVHFPNPM